MNVLNKIFVDMQIVRSIEILEQMRNKKNIEEYEIKSKDKISYYLNNSLVDNVYEEEFTLLVIYEIKNFQKEISKIETLDSHGLVRFFQKNKQDILNLRNQVDESKAFYYNIKTTLSDGLIKDLKLKQVEYLLKQDLDTLIKKNLSQRKENIFKLLMIFD